MIIRNIEKRHTPRSGFTLMEMMVVVAIIVALAGMGIYYYAGQADEGLKAKAKSTIKDLEGAAVTYRTQHQGRWPSQLSDLLTRDEEGNGPYIRNAESLIDPWGNAYRYDPSGPNNNGTAPDIYCDAPNIGRICNWSTKILR